MIKKTFVYVRSCLLLSLLLAASEASAALTYFLLLGIAPNLAAGQARQTCIYPREYGAIPDDGLPDSAELQAAIDAAIPGSIICLEAGTYEIDTTLQIKKPIIIRGTWDIILAILWRSAYAYRDTRSGRRQ